MYGPTFLRPFQPVAKSHGSQPRHRDRRHGVRSLDRQLRLHDRTQRQALDRAEALAQLDTCGANKQARRDYLGNVLLAAMDGPPDGATADAGVGS
jgi:hypothetical protein